MPNTESDQSDSRKNPFLALYARENNIDAIRLALSLIVLLSHSYSLTGRAAREPMYVFARQQTTLGTVAVDFFFVISGFLVSMSFARSASIGDYAWRRFLRIFPGYWVAMLFSLAGIWVLRAAAPGALRPVQLFLRIVDPGSFPCPRCLPTNPVPGAVNGSMWTLRYEIRCYAFVILAGLLGCLSGRKALLALIAFATVAWAVLNDWGILRTPDAGDAITIVTGQLPHWPKLLPFFCFGMLMFVVAKHRLRFSSLWAAACVVPLVAFARLGHGFEPALVVFGSYLLLWLAAHPKLRLHRFAARGDLSYGVYLYAFPIQQFILHERHDLTPLALASLAAAFTLPMAFLSWNLVEKRALRFAKRGRIAAAIPAPLPRAATDAAAADAAPSP